MKKLFLFLSIFLAALSFVSCNDDDDDDSPDKILGKWKLDQAFLNNVETTLDTCGKMTTLEFFANGTYSEKDFEYNESQTDCLPLSIVSGTWENIGNSMYEISYIDSILIEVKITFDSNIMTVEYSETIDGETFSMKWFYIKVAT